MLVSTNFHTFFKIICCTIVLCVGMLFTTNWTRESGMCQHISMQYIRPLKTRTVAREDHEIFEDTRKALMSVNKSSFNLDSPQTFSTGNNSLTINQTATGEGKKPKITHIAFLKVHKASSTTMQNIFFRFGLKNNLNILLPKRGNYLQKKADQMPIKRPNHYDVFAIHTIYHKSFFDSLLPVDAVKIAIVREPIDRMISAAYYYRDVWHKPYLTRVPRAGFIHNLVKYPEKYEPSFFSDTRNAMARDFGLPNKFKPTDTQGVQNYLQHLNSQFLLVLSVEKIDESLVLMKRLLGWELKEILYVTKNKHKHTPIVLSAYEKSKFRKTSFLDFKIYDYFTNVLDEKLNIMQEDFWKEVNYLKTILKRLNVFCSSNNQSLGIVIAKTNWNDQFSIYKNDCKLMSTNELSFIAKLRARHRQRNS